MQCLGTCNIPTFWFFQNFYQGPPQQNCVTSLTNNIKNQSGLVGFLFGAMSLFALLQLFTMCGLCKSKDHNFQDKIEFDDMQLI